jgi:hypothetical protein
MADARSLCGGTAGTGLEPLRGCFRDHVKEVSNACLLSLAKLLEVDSACRAHINQQCANVQIGEGCLEACLRTAVGTLSCKDAIVRAVPGRSVSGNDLGTALQCYIAAVPNVQGQTLRPRTNDLEDTAMIYLRELRLRLTSAVLVLAMAASIVCLPRASVADKVG